MTGSRVLPRWPQSGARAVWDGNKSRTMGSQDPYDCARGGSLGRMCVSRMNDGRMGDGRSVILASRTLLAGNAEALASLP